MKLTPASSARWMMRTESSWSVLPQAPNIIVPRQSFETWTPVRPRWAIFHECSRRRSSRSGHHASRDDQPSCSAVDGMSARRSRSEPTVELDPAEHSERHRHDRAGDRGEGLRARDGARRRQGRRQADQGRASRARGARSPAGTSRRPASSTAVAPGGTRPASSRRRRRSRSRTRRTARFRRLTGPRGVEHDEQRGERPGRRRVSDRHADCEDSTPSHGAHHPSTARS